MSENTRISMCNFLSEEPKYFSKTIISGELPADGEISRMEWWHGKEYVTTSIVNSMLKFYKHNVLVFKVEFVDKTENGEEKMEKDCGDPKIHWYLIHMYPKKGSGENGENVIEIKWIRQGGEDKSSLTKEKLEKVFHPSVKEKTRSRPWTPWRWNSSCKKAMNKIEQLRKSGKLKSSYDFSIQLWNFIKSNEQTLNEDKMKRIKKGVTCTK